MNPIHYFHVHFVKHSLRHNFHTGTHFAKSRHSRISCRVLINKIQSIHLAAASKNLRLGFVPLTDCAPLVMAHELGLYKKYGLRVTLSRELGWATIRDKVIHRELDAAHAVAGMPFAATLGLGSIHCDCLSALMLNLNGNAIVLANDLWRRGVRDGVALRGEISRLRGQKLFTFGVVFPFSSHNFLLRGWLGAAGIHPDRDVRIVVLPPPQMVTNLKAGHLDGFCVGEPWNSVAVQAKTGWCVTTSAEFDPGHPEKVLMVSREFAERRDEEHVALVAALIEGCEFCDVPGNRNEIVATLARPEYVGTSAATLRPAFDAEFDFGHGHTRPVRDFVTFHRHDANVPSIDKAAWVINHMRARNLAASAVLTPSLARSVFRSGIYNRACALRSPIKIKSEEASDPKSVLV